MQLCHVQWWQNKTTSLKHLEQQPSPKPPLATNNLSMKIKSNGKYFSHCSLNAHHLENYAFFFPLRQSIWVDGCFVELSRFSFVYYSWLTKVHSRAVQPVQVYEREILSILGRFRNLKIVFIYACNRTFLYLKRNLSHQGHQK